MIKFCKANNYHSIDIFGNYLLAYYSCLQQETYIKLWILPYYVIKADLTSCTLIRLILKLVYFPAVYCNQKISMQKTEPGGHRPKNYDQV